MKELKKGAQPKKENTQTHLDSNTLFIVCLLNFVIAFVLMVIGKRIDNNIILGAGAGIALVVLQISLFINGGEEE